MKTIAQIVPTLPPAIDGLGDYALNLARQLRQDWSLDTHFIVCNPTWPETAEIEQFRCSRVGDRAPGELLSILPDNGSILLHYSGYGYALRGCPRWLVAGLERWKKRSDRGSSLEGRDRALLTLFHEVYPYRFSPPWTSSFWLSPLQKQLAIRLLQLSDRVFTSRQNYARLLEKLSPECAETPVLPVFSNVGEPQSLLPLEQRERTAIAFGHRNMRSRLYQNFLPQLEQTCQALNVNILYDIGVPTGLPLASIKGVSIIELGILPAARVSQRMRNAIAGFLSFPPPEYLGKSTIFAAYCAHGLLPLLAESSSVAVEGLAAGKHYWAFDGTMGTLSWEMGCAIARNAQTWYQPHRLAAQAQFIANSIESISIER